MYLLDTNILSEFLRRTPNPRVIERVAAVPSTDLWTSAVCVMELRLGAMQRPDAALFWARVLREVLALIQIEPFAGDAARHAGDVLAVLEAKGLPIGVEDVQIAATALARGWIMVTANTRHFRRIPGLLVDDWTRADEG